MLSDDDRAELAALNAEIAHIEATYPPEEPELVVCVCRHCGRRFACVEPEGLCSADCVDAANAAIQAVADRMKSVSAQLGAAINA